MYVTCTSCVGIKPCLKVNPLLLYFPGMGSWPYLLHSNIWYNDLQLVICRAEHLLGFLINKIYVQFPVWQLVYGNLTKTKIKLYLTFKINSNTWILYTEREKTRAKLLISAPGTCSRLTGDGLSVKVKIQTFEKQACLALTFLITSFSVLQPWLAYTHSLDLSPMRTALAAQSFTAQTLSPGWLWIWAAHGTNSLLHPCQASARWWTLRWAILTHIRVSSLQPLPTSLRRQARRTPSSWMTSRFMAASPERSRWVTRTRLCHQVGQIISAALHQPRLLRPLGSRVSMRPTGNQHSGHTHPVQDTGQQRTPQCHKSRLSSLLVQWRICLIWVNRRILSLWPTLTRLHWPSPPWRWSRHTASMALTSWMGAYHPS